MSEVFFKFYKNDNRNNTFNVNEGLPSRVPLKLLLRYQAFLFRVKSSLRAAPKGFRHVVSPWRINFCLILYLAAQILLNMVVSIRVNDVFNGRVEQLLQLRFSVASGPTLGAKSSISLIVYSERQIYRLVYQAKITHVIIQCRNSLQK